MSTTRSTGTHTGTNQYGMRAILGCGPSRPPLLHRQRRNPQAQLAFICSESFNAALLPQRLVQDERLCCRNSGEVDESLVPGGMCFENFLRFCTYGTQLVGPVHALCFWGIHSLVRAAAEAVSN